MTTREKIYPIVTDKLPDFVKEDHQQFVNFLDAYYRYMDEDTTDISPTVAIRNALQYQDIDSTIEMFFEHFKNEYAIDIPQSTITDRSILYKNIKDYYQSRGSEKSLEFLFRIFFNDEISIFYPSEVILKPSDGKWIVEKSIKVTASVGNPFDLSSALITGATSGATAVVENVLLFNIAGVMTYELFLNTASITGTFTNGETISSNGISCIVDSPLYVYSGYYKGVDGQLDEVIRLQDSRYYQAFSYVIKSGKSFNEWGSLIANTIHPAGMALFGEVFFTGLLDPEIPLIQDGATVITRRTADYVYWVNDTADRVDWINTFNNTVTWIP